MKSMLIMILIILCLIVVIGVAGFIVYGKIQRKIKEFSRLAFGTDNLMDGFRNAEKAEEITPKSVSAATGIYLPQIMRDFPEFHFEEMKNRAENVLCAYLQSVDMENRNGLPSGVTSELQDKLNLKISDLQHDHVEEHYRNIKIHRTEIKSYQKAKGRCSIIFQTAVQYYRFVQRGDNILEGSDDRLKQTRYNVEMIYIQDRELIENQADSGLAMNCPNCGAPLPKLGAKRCMYCDTPIVEFNIRIWSFNDVNEV